ncbi:unnamed protein product [Notodromas monacha]|uniref:R3H-associated N-terminal domain-containing protein n=1 Tax=Notodromas monacha TaxID=399045 RepID=A0A7R9BJT6_9CRUS|nr:unnamed protein product [Notodromas monacha]CAG0915455.1 unnamed protein product [Notodromas monacha]
MGKSDIIGESELPAVELPSIPDVEWLEVVVDAVEEAVDDDGDDDEDNDNGVAGNTSSFESDSHDLTESVQPSSISVEENPNPASISTNLELERDAVEVSVIDFPVVEHSREKTRRQKAEHLCDDVVEKRDEKRTIGRRKARRQEREKEAERLLSKLLGRHSFAHEGVRMDIIPTGSVFARLLRDPDSMRVWLAFATASEEEQERFLSRDHCRKAQRCNQETKRRFRMSSLDPRVCRPSVSPPKAFGLIPKRLRRQIVHNSYLREELNRIEGEVILGFIAESVEDGGFMQEIIKGAPSGELSEQVCVERAEAEGRQVTAVPIAQAARPAAQAVALFYGLTCNFSRTGRGSLYAIFENNFTDFPMPLKTLYNFATDIKESLLSC